MKKKDLTELRNKSTEELSQKLLGFVKKKLALEVSIVSLTEKDSSLIGKTKRDIAQVLTLMKEKGGEKRKR